ncbi:hypothetical protein BJ875DRAFT_439148 [Amylocarpus encephaloides]|uniref:Uncharacterized protein n=1 Tax=Amylocarpus encephaloides TaxID=45428 RepID=A0A9P7YPE4_9HELO|nr:hypothetical protein BJ875DRAFT_439148 [Amylocarpus encephaloides]
MPFNELKRRDSWPPTIVHLREPHNARTDTFDPEGIDENPFSYFLSSPEDLDDDEDLSAGIESSSDPKPTIREVSPSSLQRVPLPIEEDDEDGFGLDLPLSLKDFTIGHISGRKSRAGNHIDATGLGILIPENASTRGRARARMSSERVGRGRGRARSLSARRPQSWRRPSPDIYPIEEEDDDELPEFTRTETPEIVVTTPSEAHIYHLAPPVVKPKLKKRVHWAI